MIWHRQQVLKQAPLQIALLRLGGERQEVKIVRVLEQLLGKIGLRNRECGLKVGDRLSLTSEKAALDLDDEDVSAPTVCNRGICVPKPLLPLLHHV